ncbi:hypothetical protein VNO78_02794 [Psophocarpus tetragonolobus]|uniref:Uncharacterized protein n=1 Tax=Psophocarpus tetragonolobus TaxID=3891 RepID=A0AAN9XVC3_PSOTE
MGKYHDSNRIEFYDARSDNPNEVEPKSRNNLNKERKRGRGEEETERGSSPCGSRIGEKRSRILGDGNPRNGSGEGRGGKIGIDRRRKARRRGRGEDWRGGRKRGWRSENAAKEERGKKLGKCPSCLRLVCEGMRVRYIWDSVGTSLRVDSES